MQVVPVSAAAVTLAAARPVLASVNVTVKACPAVSVDGEAASAVVVTSAGVSTSTLALAVFDVTTWVGAFASVQDAEADRESVPGVGDVHPE